MDQVGETSEQESRATRRLPTPESKVLFTVRRLYMPQSNKLRSPQSASERYRLSDRPPGINSDTVELNSNDGPHTSNNRLFKINECENHGK
jgi:hypothetical protein